VGLAYLTKTKQNNRPVRVLSGEAHGEQRARRLELLAGAAAAQRVVLASADAAASSSADDIC